MDIMCGRCGEPWDHDELHERAAELRTVTYAQVRDDFRVNGCAAFGATCTAAPSAAQRTRAAVSSVLMEVMGDDMDGVCSELADAQAFGLI